MRVDRWPRAVLRRLDNANISLLGRFLTNLEGMSICAGQLNLCDCLDINGAAGITDLAKTSED
ncbi:MAG: hypothetical protein OSA89_09630 [Mariniblastus sp.]|nr:hypothetical protein [Mariniblastus sp.]